MFPKLLEIKPLENYTLWLKYEDKTEGTICLSDLADEGIFQAWKTNEIPFENVYIERKKIVAWSENLEIGADSLYLDLRNITFEQYKKESLTYATN
jgi:Protein of unknown function (DUF2442)